MHFRHQFGFLATMTSGDQLAALGDELRSSLDAAYSAREVALSACRRVIRACGSSIRAVHGGDNARAAKLADDAGAALREAQEALRPHPSVAAAGPLHDAEKEYAEARLTAALVDGLPLPTFTDLHVEAASWLRGLAEASTELRRHLLDQLRKGDLAEADVLMRAMEDAYGLLVTMDYPDALTGGLRRHVDALRAVMERTRGDLTSAAVQARLEATIERRLGPNTSDGTALLD